MIAQLKIPITDKSEHLFAVVGWSSRLINLILKSSYIIRVELDSLTMVSERRMLSKLRSNFALHSVPVRHRNTLSSRLIPQNAPQNGTGGQSCR